MAGTPLLAKELAGTCTEGVVPKTGPLTGALGADLGVWVGGIARADAALGAPDWAEAALGAASGVAPERALSGAEPAESGVGAETAASVASGAAAEAAEGTAALEALAAE